MKNAAVAIDLILKLVERNLTQLQECYAKPEDDGRYVPYGLELVCKCVKLGLTDQQNIEKRGIKERTFYVRQKSILLFKRL